MDNNKKALFFVNSLCSGGAEKVVLNLSEELSKQGIQPIIVTLYNIKNFVTPNYVINYNLNFKKVQSNTHSMFYLMSLKSKLKYNKNWQKFLNDYSKEKFCLISAHLPLSHFVAMNSPFKNKCLYTMHLTFSYMPRITKFLYKAIVKKYYESLKIIAVSNGLHNELVNYFNIEANNVKTIYNPITIHKTHTKYSFNNKPYIVIIGRLCKQKNQIRLIQIFSKWNRNNQYNLLIVGDGKDKNKLKKYVNQEELSTKISFLPYKNNIEEIINGASLLISTSKFEGMGMVIAEALMLNTPVIASDCSYGPSEILTGSLSKYLVKLKDDDNKWINKINEVIDGKYPDLSCFCFDKFLPKNVVNKYLDIYER